MCDVEFDGYNEFTSETLRTARKEHRCTECGKTIRIGDKYTYYVAKFDGCLSQDKSCAKCTRVKETHVKVEQSMGNYGHYYMGELLSMVNECISEHKEYLKRFRVSWKGEALPEYVKPPSAYDLARARMVERGATFL